MGKKKTAQMATCKTAADLGFEVMIWQAADKHPTIGKQINDAMVAIERDNPRLEGILPEDFARPALDEQQIGELIDLIGATGLGDAENRSKDILGRVYEYSLSEFANAEGKKGGPFYAPRCVAPLRQNRAALTADRLSQKPP